MAEPLKIYESESAVLAPLVLRPPAVYTFPVELRGNALVSTVYVDTLAGAVITAVWKDYNPLTASLYTVEAHDPIVAGYNRKFIARATHGVSVLEVTVTGGSPTFGVFVAANQLVGNFASPDSVQQIAGTIIAQTNAFTTAVIQSATIAVANVEQSHTFPAGTQRFLLKPRGIGRIQLAYGAGLSGTDFLTISPGSSYKSEIFVPSAKSIYFQSPVVGLAVELESWS